MALNQAKTLNIDQSNLFALYVEKTSGNYVVPAFQRQYVWKNEHISDFFETLTSSDETYLGTVILRSIGTNVHEIVDGQQRAITLQIFSAAVSNYCQSNKFDNWDKIYSAYRHSINVNVDNFGTVTGYRLTVGKTISNFFGNYITGENVINASTACSRDESVVKYAYLHLYELLEEYLEPIDDKFDELRNIYNNLRSKYVSLIVVSSEDIAYEIFESVNSKGEELDASDLLKNSIIRNSGGSDDLVKEWDEIYKNVTSSKISLLDFLQYYWSAVHGYSSKKKLFISIKSKQEYPDDWLTLSSDLLNYSRYLRTLLTGDKYDFEDYFKEQGELDDIYYGVLALRCLTAKTWAIPYLSLFHHANSNNGKLANISRKFLVFFSKYTICYFNLLSRPGNVYFTRSYELARKIREHSKNSKELQSLISSETIKLRKLIEGTSSQQLESSIASKVYSRNLNENMLLKYYLHQYELTQLQNVNNLSKDFTAASLEHILPQDPKKWGYDKNMISPFVNSIGNMALLLSSANKSIGNLPIDDKFNTYKQAGYEHTRQLKVEDWPSNDLATIRKTIEDRKINIAIKLGQSLFKSIFK